MSKNRKPREHWFERWVRVSREKERERFKTPNLTYEQCESRGFHAWLQVLPLSMVCTSCTTSAIEVMKRRETEREQRRQDAKAARKAQPPLPEQSGSPLTSEGLSPHSGRD